jgi:tetratricopeptide (TPR) repeat protein
MTDKRGLQVASQNENLQRGLAAAQARKPQEAARWFRQAVEDNPSDIVSSAWLGQALCASGERYEGTRRLLKAGTQLLATGKAEDFSKVIEILGQLQQWGELPLALDLCREAADQQPDNFRVQQMLAVCLGQLNQADEALLACAKAMSLAPVLDPMLSILQASLEADARNYERAQSHLKSILNTSLGYLQAFRAHKELGRTLDALADYDAAFESLTKAGEISPMVPEFQRLSLKLLPAMISANHSSFTKDLLDKWAGKEFADTRSAPVFLIGFYRSGTTLTQAVLDSHPDIFVADESNLLFDVQNEIQRLDTAQGLIADKLARLGAKQIEQLRALYWRQARGRYGEDASSTVFVDKFTMNTIDVGVINVIFPDAKIIFMMRDPRDVCLSCFMQLMVPSPATIHLHNWQTTADFYATVMRWWMHIRDMLTLQFIEVRYEDAVTEFEKTYRAMLGFLGLEWDDSLTRFHERAAGKFIASPSRNQVARPIYATSVNRWKNYGAHFASVQQTLAPFVAAYGYSANIDPVHF